MMSKTYGRCVICGKSAYALRESLEVCSEHADAIDDGWTIEVENGEYRLTDLEEINYEPRSYTLSLAPATPAPAEPDADVDKPIWHMEIDELRLEVEQSRLHTEDLQAELARARTRIEALEAALEDAESVLYHVQTRLPMTDSYKNIKQIWVDVRSMAQEYFKKQSPQAQPDAVGGKE